MREIGGAIRGDKEVLGRFRAELGDRLRWQRVSLGKEHSEAVRGIESKAGEFYREGLEGSEKRAREAARSGRDLSALRLASQSRDRRGPERRGPDRDFGPSR